MRYQAVMRTNGAWAHSMDRVVKEDARRATGKRLSMQETVWSVTEEEVVRRHGIRQGPKPGRALQDNPMFHPDGRPQMIDKMMSKSV